MKIITLQNWILRILVSLVSVSGVLASALCLSVMLVPGFNLPWLVIPLLAVFSISSGWFLVRLYLERELISSRLNAFCRDLRTP